MCRVFLVFELVRLRIKKMNLVCAKKPKVVDEYMQELEMHLALRRYAEAKINGIGCAKPVTSEERKKLEEARFRGARCSTSCDGIQKKKRRVTFEGDREKHQRRLNTMERALWEARKRDAEHKKAHPNKPRDALEHTLDNFQYLQVPMPVSDVLERRQSLVGVAYQLFRMP